MDCSLCCHFFSTDAGQWLLAVLLGCPACRELALPILEAILAWRTLSPLAFGNERRARKPGVLLLSATSLLDYELTRSFGSKRSCWLACARYFRIHRSCAFRFRRISVASTSHEPVFGDHCCHSLHVHAVSLSKRHV